MLGNNALLWMTLCALICNNIKGINTCNDLVQVMEMGNELHSTLSLCTGQVYLINANRITSYDCYA